MCFSSKVKQPKVSPQSIAAPAPVAEEAPKGVEFGDDSSSDNSDTTDGVKDLKVTKEKTGEGTQSAVASDTGTAPVKKTTSASIKRALKR
ncbi:putative phage head protein [Pseudomonas rubra]|uniref:DUF5476 domain-containing protein n=1 Tax=Pseudomonas rubra TaxID=2942627 RepID=A0ABT5P6D1_9PSED|nr:putative phage head protein [Pseudomonas rubra]MDD1013856.1 DUF5476 domain-containing protein [Pseudomonas rubra]MDD1038323.1 DUF5476 domain-containing protein [Pseudomonas rubra]MDD1154587.1 DUF5476 domain-containing protein [Pseudomonas rubra]